jgi:alpha-tubulin suppressor-like RCC1 family protein
MTIHIRDGGVWKEVTQPSVRESGVWKNCSSQYIKESDVWKEVFSSGYGYEVFGDNYYGLLGTGNQIDIPTPVSLGVKDSMSSVSFALYGCLFIKTDSTLWCVGRSLYGELGATGSKSSPAQVGSNTNWLNVASGNQHSAAIKTDGTLWTTGSNANGQLGINNITDQTSFTQVGTQTYWTDVICLAYSTMAVGNSGRLYFIGGNNEYGLNGLEEGSIFRSSPVQVGTLTTWSKLYGRVYSVGAIKTDGSLWVWGSNTDGQLCLSNIISKSSPVQVGTGTNWSKLSMLNGNCLFGIKTDGTLWASGANNHGILGVNDCNYRSSPTQVGSDTNWSFVDNYDAAFSIKTNGTLWVWGPPGFATCINGLGDTVYRSSPTQIGSVTNYTKIFAGCGAYAIVDF